MKTFEITFEVTFSEVKEVEAGSLKEAIDNFDMDEAICNSDMDPVSMYGEVLTEDCREIEPYVDPHETPIDSQEENV